MSLSIVTRTGAILLFILFYSLPATAQQESGDTLRVYSLDEIIISASRWEQSPQTVGRNVTVISSDELNSSLYSSVGEILAERQGLHIVGDNQTDGSVQSLFMRNANSNHSTVMIDGVRVTDPSTPGNSIDLSELSLAGVERIEIVRGAHSTLYGSSSIGGVVNIITRKGSEAGFSGFAETGHGTFGSGTYALKNRVGVNYSPGGGFYADLGAAQQWTRGLDATVDTVRTPGVFNPRDGDDFQKLDLNGRVGYGNNGLNLYVSYRRADQEKDLDQSAYTDDDNAETAFLRNLYSYGGSYMISDRFEVAVSGAYSNLRRTVVNDSSVVDVSGNYDGTVSETEGEGTIWEHELTGRFNDNGISAVAGVGSSRQTMSTYNYTYSRAFSFESETDLDSLDLHEQIYYGFLYAELNGGLIDGGADAFTLGLGARLSHHDEFGSHLTYEINPRVQVTPSALLYGSLATGFNAPSLYRLYSPALGFGAYTNRGNGTLDPETSVSIEAGWKQEIGSVAYFELSLFRTRVQNSIEYISLWKGGTPIGSLGGGDYLGDTYINISEQVTHGAELGFEAQIMPRVRLNGNMTYAHSTSSFAPGDIDESYTGGHHVQIYEGGQFVDEEKEVDGLVRRPALSAGAGVLFQVTDRLTTGIDTRFVGSNDDIYYSATLGPFGAVDRAEVDSYTLTDFHASYRFAGGISLGARIENIFNTDYTEINGYRTRPRAVYGRLKVEF